MAGKAVSHGGSSYMFRSKGFTVAFIILSIMIIGLTAVLCYLLIGTDKMPGSGDIASQDPGQIYIPPTDPLQAASLDAPVSSDEPPAADTSSEEASASPEEAQVQEESSVLRALNSSEEHVYPVAGEEIPVSGAIAVVKPGDFGEGIVFHANPVFDDASTPGNVMQYGGGFRVSAKVYVNSGTDLSMMYKTTDGYYVTSNPNYIQFTPDAPSAINADPSKVALYGKDELEGALLQVYSDDGSHVAFTLFYYEPQNGVLTPALADVIASYSSYGVGSFEYRNTDGRVYTGTICFENLPEGKIVDLNFPGAITLSTGDRSEMVLHISQ